MKNSQTIKTFKRVDGGEIAVDYNSGRISEIFNDAEGTEIQNIINLNSLIS